MKKLIIIAALHLAFCLSLIGQVYKDYDRQGGQRQRRSMDMVVDTAVINHIDLNAEVLQKVYALQESKQQQQRELMQGMRPGKGQRMSEEERKAIAEKREAFTSAYRKELRELIGDEAYILYLEKMLDRQGMMRMGGARIQGQQNGQRGGGQFPQGGQFPGGGFQGGDGSSF